MKRYPMDLFRARVSAVTRLSRDFVRVSLAGPELTGLAAPAGDGGGHVLDAYIKLLIPHPERPGPVHLDVDDEDWRVDWFAADPQERGGWMRTYTLRDARPWADADGTPGVEIDVDFVLHGAPDGAPMDDASSDPASSPSLGPGADWASRARVGQELTFIGPDRKGQLWTMWKPGAARSVVVCADETAVPAVLSVMRDVPQGSSALFLIEVPEGNEELARLVPDVARERPDLHVRWLPRAAGQTRGEPSLDALREAFGLVRGQHAGPELERMAREHPMRQDDLVWGASEEEDSETYVYLAGEASVVRSARRICINEAGLDKSSISFMGYWKAGLSEN